MGEIQAIGQRYQNLEKSDKETVVFTGSSSIRFWDSLEEEFPQYTVINSGFGGSMASDLLVYLDEAILRYNPDKVFIYEGDNDIEKPKNVNRVFRQIRRIYKRIQKHNPETEVYLIGVKPSPVRWHLKDDYKELNQKLKAFSDKTVNLEFIPIWDVLIRDGQPIPEIFLEDGLHLNQKGYDILNSTIKNHL